MLLPEYATAMGVRRNFSREVQRYFAYLFPFVGDIGVGVGKFLWVRRIFAQISPNLPEKYSKQNCLQKNDCISFYVWHIFSNQKLGTFQTFFQINVLQAPFLPKFP